MICRVFYKMLVYFKLQRNMKFEKQLILHNIRSAYNVGAIFRSADGAGVSKIFLSGHTPAPIDRFGRQQPEIQKTSLGASETVEWQQIEEGTILVTLESLRCDGFQIVSVEQDPRSVSLADFGTTEKVVYILGNEIDGVDKEVLDVSDTILEIPMKGKKESLNVSVTAGIVLFKR